MVEPVQWLNLAAWGIVASVNLSGQISMEKF